MRTLFVRLVICALAFVGGGVVGFFVVCYPYWGIWVWPMPPWWLLGDSSLSMLVFLVGGVVGLVFAIRQLHEFDKAERERELERERRR
ncbi:MAG: hypothetical protein NTW86_24390 [Candidatus Sumerlaeota bacterium]|nr:hypothetical protein [Candidatus Sumerlaeota bacterium]